MLPPRFKVPDPLKVKSSFASPIEIFPVTVTAPVDRVTPEDNFELPVAAMIIELHDRVPEPTAIILLSLFPVPLFMVTTPDTVKLMPELRLSLLEEPPGAIVSEEQAAFAVTVTVAPFAIVTSSAGPGTTPSAHVDVEFQFPVVILEVMFAP
jgi:hypothetical protein